MTVPDLLSLDTISEGSFQLYRAAILGSGIVLVLLAVWGRAATILARIFDLVIGVILIGYAGYLYFRLVEGHLYAVYPFLFILPIMVVGYHFYTRAINREIDAQLEAEQASRKAEATAPGEVQQPAGERDEGVQAS